MKASIISMCVTVLVAAGIVIAGYQGITYVGKEIVKIDSKITMVEEDKKLKYMFYSETDEQIQIFPWNYENQEDAKEIEADVYKTIKGNGVAENMNMLAVESICMRLDLPEDEDTKLMKELRPKKTDFKQILVSTFEGQETYFFYNKKFTVKKGVDYNLKYVLIGDELSLIAFYCGQIQKEEEKKTYQKEEQIIRTLKGQAGQILKMVSFLEGYSFKNSWIGHGSYSYITFKYLFLGKHSGVYEGIGNEKETQDQENYGATTDEGNLGEDVTKELEEKLSTYEILVLSDRILLIAEGQRVILQYSRKDCKLLGFSIN